MTTRRMWLALLTSLAALATLSLAGCGAGAFGLLKDAIGGSNDGSVTGAEAELARVWFVRSYSGEQLGAVVVPADAGMTWVFDREGTFAVTSTRPLASGPGVSRTYNDTGTWRVVNAVNRVVELTLTKRSGIAVPENQRVPVSGQWYVSGRSLALTTTVLGHESIRYVMER